MKLAKTDFSVSGFLLIEALVAITVLMIFTTIFVQYQAQGAQKSHGTVAQLELSNALYDRAMILLSQGMMHADDHDHVEKKDFVVTTAYVPFFVEMTVECVPVKDEEGRMRAHQKYLTFLEVTGYVSQEGNDHDGDAMIISTYASGS